ncbi:MAG: hypothetical protein OXU77_11855 [Gammaproteobacteria bacterium]|nr:hypothetical protein [Gammaproteobacteria bacterium]MDE0444960.1 hypothetical protein [Gammaproteobacteria bacterium]
MARVQHIRQVDSSAAIPEYELRTRRRGLAEGQFEIWQLPSPATPQVAAPIRVAGLKGRNLELVEHRVLKRLAAVGVRPMPIDAEMRGYALPEDVALALGLLFRVLAPMRSRDNMRAVAEGIEQMDREEAAYWLGMAMHRKHPRRVLSALRVLLTLPKGSERP